MHMHVCVLINVCMNIPNMQSDMSALTHIAPLTKSPRHHLTAVLVGEFSHPTSVQGQVASAIVPMSIADQEIVAGSAPE